MLIVETPIKVSSIHSSLLGAYCRRVYDLEVNPSPQYSPHIKYSHCGYYDILGVFNVRGVKAVNIAGMGLRGQALLPWAPGASQKVVPSGPLGCMGTKGLGI